MRGQGSNVVSVVWPHWSLTVGFLLIRYAVLCTVESLSLDYLLFISRFLCIWRWYIDKLGIFHANQTSICFDSTSEIRVRFVPSSMFKPSNNFHTDRSKVVLLLWIIFAVCISCHTVLSVPCSLVDTCWERADLLALLYAMFSCVFVTSRCSIWLYRFLIFAVVLTLLLIVASIAFENCVFGPWFVMQCLV